jgi:Mechanosensitive ion channel
VDLEERRQLDAAREHLSEVKARAKPWRAIFFLVVAVIAAVVSAQARHAADHPEDRLLGALGRHGNLALAYGAAVVFLLFASFATIGLANKAREVMLPSIGYAHAAVVRYAVVVAGGLATIIVTLQLLGLPVTQLVVGGAVTGVIIGIAAQQSLANVFAGMILLTARPFRVGDRIGMRSGALSGLLEGTVTQISLTYVLLDTANGPVHVPNSQVLAAAVGPAGAVPGPAAPGPPPAGREASPEGRDAPPGGRDARPDASEGPHGGQEAAPDGQDAGSAAPGALAGASAAEADSSAPAQPHAADAQAAQRDADRQPS